MLLIKGRRESSLPLHSSPRPHLLRITEGGALWDAGYY